MSSVVPLHGCPLLCTTKAKFPIYSQANCETLKCGDPLHFLKTCVQDSIIILVINPTLLGFWHMKNMWKTYWKHLTNIEVLRCYLYVSHMFVTGLDLISDIWKWPFHICKHMNNTSKHTNYIWPLTSGGASRLKNTPTTKCS